MRKAFLILFVALLSLFIITSCSDNNDTNNGGDSHTHEPIYFEGVAATCSQEGLTSYYECSICGKRFSDSACTNEITDIVLPKLAHEMVHHEKVTATCTLDGMIEYWRCELCGKYFLDAEGNKETTNLVIEALNHDLVLIEETEATCAHTGTKIYKCSRCNKEVHEVEAALGHEFNLENKCTKCNLEIRETEGLRYITNESKTMYGVYIDDLDLEEVVIPAYHNENGLNLPVVSIMISSTKPSNIKSITFTNKIESIGVDVFNYCNKLEKVNYLGSLVEWNDISLYNKESNPLYYGADLYIDNKLVTSLEDSNITYINHFSFVGWNVDKLVLPSTLTGISPYGIIDAKYTSFYYPNTLDNWNSIKFDNCDSNPLFKTGELNYIDGKLESLEQLNIESIGNFVFAGLKMDEIILSDKVKTIGIGAFYKVKAKNIVFGSDLTSIGYGAFYDIAAETDFSKSTNLDTIGGEAFSYYEGSEFVIPASVTTLGQNLFAYSHAKVSFAKNTKIHTIGENVFARYEGKEIVIPKTVYTIEKYAFNDSKCDILFENGAQIYQVSDYAFANTHGNNIYLPSSLTYISMYCFKDSSINIVWPNDSKCTQIREYAFDNYTNSSKVLTIPNNITSLYGYVFTNCSLDVVLNINPKEISGYLFYNYLGKNVTIPDHIEVIGSGAFSNCPNLEKLNMGTNIKSIEGNAFEKTDKLNIDLSKLTKLENIGYAAFREAKCMTGDLIIPDSVTYIDGEAFKECRGIDGNIKLSNTLTYIGKSAFENCVNIKGNLVFPDTLETIDEMAFRKCTSITGDLIIPNSVTTIGMFAFAESGLNGKIVLSENLEVIPYSFVANTEVTGDLIIPEGVTKIETSAFYSTNIISVTFPNTLETIEAAAFNKTKLNKEIKFPESLKKIFDWAFEECYDLPGEIILPSKLESIGYGAFCNCTSIEKVIIPESVIEIGERIFEGCTNLREVDIKGNVEEIPYNMLFPTGLETIYLPKTLKDFGTNFSSSSIKNIYFAGTISDWINIEGDNPLRLAQGNVNFYIDNTLVEELTIPNGVTEIKDDAFSHTTIKKVNFPDGLISIGSFAFDNTLIEEINCPDSVQSIGYGAFNGCKFLTKIKISKNLIDDDNYIINNISPIEEAIIPAFLAYQLPESLKKLTIINGEIIEEQACQSRKNLEEVIIDAPIKRIEDYAFSNCINLRKINLPETLEFIGIHAFSYCQELKNIVIPKSVSIIETQAFFEGPLYLYTELTAIPSGWDVSYSSSNKIILDYKNNFVDQDGLVYFEYGDFLYYYDDYSDEVGYAWQNKKITGEITILSQIEYNGKTYNIEEISEKAFRRQNEITSVIIEEGIKYIEEYAFSGCSSLKEVKFPSTLKSIYGYGFSGCPLEEIELPDELEGLSNNIFSGSKIKLVKLPSSMINLMFDTFANCEYLTEIIIPKSINYIRQYSVELNSTIKNVFYEGTEEEWNLINTEYNNDEFNFNVYYYSENGPIEGTNSWHYDENNKPVIW